MKQKEPIMRVRVRVAAQVPVRVHAHLLNLYIVTRLQSSLQIQHTALSDDGMSHAGDIKSRVAYLSRGSIIAEGPHTFESVHVICALKPNTGMISLYRTITACQELK